VIGLLSLSAHRDPGVRSSALHAVARSGIRVSEGMDRLRAALRDEEREVVLAAYHAVGAVGDATDIAALLDGLDAKDARLRSAALRALRSLTRVRLPASAAAWEYWWDEARARLPARIDGAIARLLDGGDAPDRDEVCRLLETSAWFDVPKVCDAVRAAIRSGDARVRTMGFRIAETARLGDVAEEVGSEFKYEDDPDVWPLAKQAALTLGARTEGILPPGLSEPFPSEPRDPDAALAAEAAAQRTR
jgi:hypothetical protein